jgi:hypothetical protein
MNEEPSSPFGTFSHLRRRKREKAIITNFGACIYRLLPRFLAWEKVPKGDEGSLVATRRGLKVSLLISLMALPASAHAETVKNPLAQFSGLDKITGLTTQFEIKINEEAKFGSLIVKPFVCNTRPITEEPKTASFVQVQDVAADGSKKMIFSGWMFAESPGLNAVEHPTFDVWLTGCRDPKAPPPPVETAPPADPGAVPEEGGGGTVQD